VAEGAETYEDVTLLCRMGVEFVQANFLCAAVPLQDLWATGQLGLDTKTPLAITGRVAEKADSGAFGYGGPKLPVSAAATAAFQPLT